MWQIFWRFLLLGCVSFGGPIAHIGYFRRTFVAELQWLSAEQFAATLALCQFLPGPASSQLGFAIGLQRGGLAGGIAAFCGFTLPSFLLMYGIAVSQQFAALAPWQLTAVMALKLLAVVVVADALLSMAQQFCQQRREQALALLAAIWWLLSPSLLGQCSLLLLVALFGGWTGKSVAAPAPTSSLQLSVLRWPLLLFVLLLLASFFSAGAHPLWSMVADFYQAGSLVFGGGHVVLPLLQSRMADSVNTDVFLSGYALAQMVPGPMFTLGTFLGAQLLPISPLLGALSATLALFLPGLLLVLAFNAAWSGAIQRPVIGAISRALNAAVVGILLATLYQPVWTSTVQTPWQMALILLGLLLLRVGQVSIKVLLLGVLLAILLICLFSYLIS